MDCETAPLFNAEIKGRKRVSARPGTYNKLWRATTWGPHLNPMVPMPWIGRLVVSSARATPWLAVNGRHFMSR
eukprot:8521201-Ditylum_brightwellii.AAC.1